MCNVSRSGDTGTIATRVTCHVSRVTGSCIYLLRERVCCAALLGLALSRGRCREAEAALPPLPPLASLLLGGLAELELEESEVRVPRLSGDNSRGQLPLSSTTDTALPRPAL